MSPPSAGRTRPPFAVALTVTVCLVIIMAFLRLVWVRHAVMPIAYGVPLLIALWHRDRRLLYGMAAAFTLLTVVKISFVLPEEAATADVYRHGSALLVLLDIWTITIVLALVISDRGQLEDANQAISHANAELRASNEELSAREEEIRSQNEELQSQAEELDQQMEELRQLSEELARQNEEQQVLNEELARRERALQTLLDSARLFSEGVSEKLLSRVCEATLAAMEGSATAVAVVEASGDQLIVRAHAGFGPDGPVKQSWSLNRSFAQLALEAGKTAFLPDLALRPDLEIPQPFRGPRALRSVLLSPLRVQGRIVGVLEAYSEQPREWTEQEFQILEWLAAESSVVMEAALLQRELQDRRREAEESSVRKTRFLAAVSHDVRTPANAINLLAELISQSTSDPQMFDEIPELVRDLRVSARSLVDLVTDVLDLARMDTATPEVQDTTFEIGGLIDAEVRQQRPVAESRGLVLAAEKCAPVWVRTDRVKLARVLANLTGNALKFTNTGTVTIGCEQLMDGAIGLSVSDTGIGISTEHLPHVFDEFFQLRNPERDRSKGTGMGLAICKRLADVIGCRLSVESAIGHGSRFTVHIPASKIVPAPVPTDATTNTAAAVEVSDSRSLGGIRVLLVEDHDVTREITSRLLKARGAIVTEAENARAAINVLSCEGPQQVLLLDLMLPDMDGREVLKYIRQNSPAALRCILAVSGDVTTRRTEEVRELGADGLIAKPVDMDRLTRTIHKILQERLAAS